MNQVFLEDRAKCRDALTLRYDIPASMYDEASLLLAPMAVAIHLRKGEYLQQAGTPARSIHWLHSGVARIGFIGASGNEVTQRFFMDGGAAAAHDDVLRAFSGQPAVNFLVAETAVHGYRLDAFALVEMAKHNPLLRDYYLKLAQYGAMESGRRTYLAAAPAQGRLEAFRRDYPGLEQRVSQKVLASFLGITPQYMSQLLRHNAPDK